MSLPTDHLNPTSLGIMAGGGEPVGTGGFAVLTTETGLWKNRDPRWCPDCGRMETFLQVYECDSGRIGVCLGCGGEKREAFTRTVGEAA